MNTNKFKAGDKVRITSCSSSSYWYANKIGEVFTISDPSEFGYFIEEKLVSYVKYSVKECDIELVKEEWKDGIPQVGTICEAYLSSYGAWKKVEVLKVIEDGNKIRAAVYLGPTDQLFWSTNFRPIKTAEEIAAEEEAKERERVVEQMYAHTRTSSDSLVLEVQREVCEDLYDAGYRWVKAE